MSAGIDETNDATLRSWVASAEDPHTDFPLQNLPLGRFRRRGSDEPLRTGVAIGDQVLDLRLALAGGSWAPEVAGLLEPLARGDLNAFLARGADARRTLRVALSQALREGAEAEAALRPCLLPQSQAAMALPCEVGDYTDFYTGIHHATTVGRLFRPDQPLLPNYEWVPIGYHGRASSLQPTGQAFHRPHGQYRSEAAAPVFGPCQRLDYELELGAIIGPGNPQGEPIPIERAEDHLAGLVLLNDWSARDVQAWEYQPLGPFLSKSFATTLSPWIVTMEALQPFRRPFVRAADRPQPLPHLDGEAHRARGAIDIVLEVWLQTPSMRERGEPAVRLTQSNFQEAYWTLAQLVAHHSSNGCNLRPGDLLGSGTQSGPQPEQGGSLLELTQGGKVPITLPSGETRRFLMDGDSVGLRAYCKAEGWRRIGFGECVAEVLPARVPSSP